MKRIRDTFRKATDKQRAVASIIEGTRFKRGKRGVQKLLYDSEKVKQRPELYHQIDPEKADAYANVLTAMLKKKTWRHKRPQCKRQYCPNRTKGKGKWSTLYIPTLDDHIIGHMLIDANKEAFTRGMHPHCCGSVPGRGISRVIELVERWMRDDKQCRYFVKLDIRHFFDNINAEKLKATLRTKIKDPDSLWGLDQIIDSAPVACPVGYYTSPWFANLYLEKLDWYVEQQLYKTRRGKRIKYVRHFLRYIDDILLIGTSRTDLEKAVHGIIAYLRENYQLEIKPEWEIKKIGKHDGDKLAKGTYWLDMGGYKFCKDATILRDGIFLSAARLAREMYKASYYTIHQCLSINSKIGWAKHSDHQGFIGKYILPYVNIKQTRRIIGYVAKIEQLRICQAT